MSRKVRDLTGRKFGRLTVLRLSPVRKHGKAVFVCQCECGNIKRARGSHLLLGSVKSCGCLAADFIKNLKRLKKGEASFNRVFADYKNRAVMKTHEFKLSKQLFRELIVKPCVYCGDSLSNTSKTKHCNGAFKYTGLDRVDNNRGYIKDNVEPCCTDCNFAKAGKSKEEFLVWIERLKNFNPNHSQVDE